MKDLGFFFYRRKFLYIIIRSAKRCQTDDLWKLRESLIGKKRHMAQNFMAYVWLRCIKWLTTVAYILSAVKYPEG